MIDMNEIEVEIDRLESEELTYANCAKLADLYIIRENFKGTVDASRSSFGQSEFLQICSNAPIENVLSVLDEHMECIRVLYPKEYSAILRKIRM